MTSFALRPFLLAAGFALAAQALAQGPLTPPGPPGASMRSLAQIEPRTPIPGGTGTVTIAAPGSYYLTGDIVVASGNGIEIGASGVSLDLNGFSVVSSAQPAAGAGIVFAAGSQASGVQVLNGFVRSASDVANTGWAEGISLSFATNSLVRDVAVRNIHGHGIQADMVRDCIVDLCADFGIKGSVVRGCRVNRIATTGIFADVATECSASECGVQGVLADAASNCRAQNSAASGAGVNGSSIQNCYASVVSGTALGGTAVLNSTGASINGTGINCPSGVVTNSVGATQANSPAIYGLRAFTANGSRGTGPVASGQFITNKYNMP